MIDLLELLKYLVPVLLIAAILCYYFEKILRALEKTLSEFKFLTLFFS